MDAASTTRNNARNNARINARTNTVSGTKSSTRNNARTDTPRKGGNVTQLISLDNGRNDELSCPGPAIR